jgi:hypothetical protein
MSAMIEPHACVIETIDEDDTVFDMERLASHWEDINRSSFSAEACFFNCQNNAYKRNVLEHLIEVETAMTDYTQCIFEGLERVKFMEKSISVLPLPPGAFCYNSDLGDPVIRSHPAFRVTHKDIVAQIEQYEVSRNVADLIGLKHKVEVMKECVRVYVDLNVTNTKVYIVDEKDPNYSDVPAWMFFPFQK